MSSSGDQRQGSPDCRGVLCRGFAVEEELGGVAVGVDLDHLLFVRLAPADGPGVAVDVGHGGFGPVGLEDEEASFLVRSRSTRPF